MRLEVLPVTESGARAEPALELADSVACPDVALRKLLCLSLRRLHIRKRWLCASSPMPKAVFPAQWSLPRRPLDTLT
jgi:hypothetical protein